MNPIPDEQLAEPDKVLAARADERLAHAYEQIARADEQLARVTERLSSLETDAARPSSPAAGRRRPGARSALRGLVGLLLAACIVVAAFVSQSSYAETAKLAIAHWAPRLGLASLLPAKTPWLAQPSPSTVQITAAEPATEQPAPLTTTASQDVVPTAVPASADLAQLLQTMARDLANVEQGIEQLKARQEEMASNNARAIEQIKAGQDQLASDSAKTTAQLKASQEQMASVIAKVSEPGPRPKVSTAPSQLASKRLSTVSSAQARAQPQKPSRLRPAKLEAVDSPRR